MKLTGKAKKFFEKWAKIKNDCRGYVDFFNALGDSEKYGVYVDWFDSVWIYIQIETRAFDKNHPTFIHSHNFTRVGCFKTRQEARTEAIKKANEIYNN